MDKSDKPDNVRESYEQLKKDLKDKFSSIIGEAVEKLRKDTAERSAEVFGREVINYMQEADEIKREIFSKREEFYNSDEYKDMKNRLTEQKNELDGADEEESKRITAEMKKNLDEISTMQVALSNRLKPQMERVLYLSSEIEKQMSLKKTEFESFKEEITQKIKTEIFFLVDEYNQELRSLSSVFGIEESEPELPFDGDAVRLDLPIFGYGDELFSDDDQSTFIKSENFSGVKN